MKNKIVQKKFKIQKNNYSKKIMKLTITNNK